MMVSRSIVNIYDMPGIPPPARLRHGVPVMLRIYFILLYAFSPAPLRKFLYIPDAPPGRRHLTLTDGATDDNIRKPTRGRNPPGQVKIHTNTPPSSSGLGYQVLILETGVRVPVGVWLNPGNGVRKLIFLTVCRGIIGSSSGSGIAANNPVLSDGLARPAPSTRSEIINYNRVTSTRRRRPKVDSP